MVVPTYPPDSFEFPDASMLLLIILLTLVISYVMSRSWKNVNFPPGPVGLPMIGYLPYLDPEPHKTLDKLAKKYGDVFSVSLFSTRIVVLNNWTCTEEALGNGALDYRPHGLFDTLPNGLGFGEENGSKWKEQRKFCIRATNLIIQGSTSWKDLFQKKVSQVVDGLLPTKGHPVDVVSTLQVPFASHMMTLLFDQKLDDKTVTSMAEKVGYIMQTFPVLSPIPFLPSLVLYVLTTLFMAKKLRPLKTFSHLMERCIQNQMGDAEGEECFVNKYLGKILLDEKNAEKTSFTHSSLRGNVQAFMIGGAETSRTAFVWLLLAMSEHQQFQEKVHLELESAPGAGSSWEDRRRIPYTCAAISEALRWRTIVPINQMRLPSEDMKIEGYDIPRGTVVVVNSWAVHNDPERWPEPDKFRPERFLDQDGQYLHGKIDNYMPFSLGKRNCPGEQLVRMEILNYFSKIMRKFTVLPAEGSTHPSSILGLTYQPTNVWLRFEPRTI